MADRRRQIELLIATRFDHLWFPGGALRTSAGLAPSKRVPCPACSGGDRPGMVAEKRSGMVVRWDPCPACGGRPASEGVRAKRGRGFIAVDPMDTDRRQVGSTDTRATARPRKRVKCDACQDRDGKPTGVLHGNRCPHCDGAGWRDFHRFDLRLDRRDDADQTHDPIYAAMIRRDELASWHPLEKALAQIHRTVNKPLRYLALTIHAKEATDLLDEVNLYRRRSYDQLTTFERALYDLAIGYIDTEMPDPIRVPPGAAANERERAQQLKTARGRGSDPHARKLRDEQIRRWAREGRPYTWICQQVDLSDRQVREIINGKGVAA